MNGELRDIKPLLEIPDYSYGVFMILLIFMGVTLLFLLFFLLRKFWFKRQVDMKKIYFERLKNVNWKRAKEASYEVTYFGRLLTDDPRAKEIYQQILPLLEVYKYKKDVPLVDAETLKQYNLLVHVIDETL